MAAIRLRTSLQELDANSGIQPFVSCSLVPRNVLHTKGFILGACGHQLPHSYFAIEKLLATQAQVCPECGAPVDLLTTLRDETIRFSPFFPLGANQTSFSVEIVVGEARQLDFTRVIGPEAKILEVNYTATMRVDQPTVLPIEVHVNTPHRVWPLSVWLTGLGSLSGDTVEVNVWVTWVPKSVDDQSWECLANAYRALRERTGNTLDLLVSANVSVEARLGRLLTDFLHERVGLVPGRTKSFLKDGATYGHQLSALLPMVCRLTGLPELPPRVYQGLVALKGLRNEVGHGGALEKPLSLPRCAELLVCAAMGTQYVDLLRKRLLSPQE